jgi:hypothetical protein
MKDEGWLTDRRLARRLGNKAGECKVKRKRYEG